MYTLYGDGIHNDTPALQELLDSRVAEVYLPAPKDFYYINKPLKIHTGQTLRMAPTTRIRLCADSNCCMIENDDFSIWAENICIDGGIWDYNNVEQEPNPYHFPGKDGKTFYDRLGIGSALDDRIEPLSKLTQLLDQYVGFIMRFCRVRGLVLKNITYRDPVTYGAQLAYVEDFTIRDIRFDYAHCNPKWWNMDGVHIEGNCKNGYLCNLKGTCHDDLVAITSDDSLYGPIENIVVDGIYSEHCHSAVRLLSHGIPIKNITIRNVFGSYYVYCIGLTKYYGGPEERGIMENITIDGVAAHTCAGTKDVPGGRTPLIWVQDGLDIKGLQIKNVYREEKEYPTPLFQIDPTAKVKRLILDNLVQKSSPDISVPFLLMDGEVEDLVQGFLKEYKE